MYKTEVERWVAPRVAEDVGPWAGESRIALLGGGNQHLEAEHTAF